MGERVIVRQNSQFETEILASDPHSDEDQLHPIEDFRQLTAYGMLLASLGSCTAIVMHTYAQHHGLDLQDVELRLEYDRIFTDDCEECEEIQEYKEQIEKEIVVVGSLTPQERKRLYRVSHYCPIHKMLEGGIEVRSALTEEASSP
ncbi:MAG: OsmC family protein [Anaerolineae bacterium]|jgi:putative redox protein